MQDGSKAVWSILYVSVAFFPRLKQNFIAYRSSSRPDCIFWIHQLWHSDFSRVYSNCCWSCSFAPEILKFSQSSHKMYSNYILNFQESTTILNACKESLDTYWRHQVYIYIYIYIYIFTRGPIYFIIFTLISLDQQQQKKKFIYLCMCVCVCGGYSFRTWTR